MKSKTMNKMLHCLMLCMLFVPAMMQAQQKFNKFYTLEPQNNLFDGYMNDFVVDSTDEATYLVGQTENYVYNPGYTYSRGYLAKVNSSGVSQWHKMFNAAIDTNIGAYKKVIITSDAHLLALTGTYNRGGHGSGAGFIYGQMMLHKMDKLGNMVAGKNCGNDLQLQNTFSDGRSLIEAKNAQGLKSYVAAGQYVDLFVANPGIVKSTILAVSTQTNLTLQWRQLYSFFPVGTNHIEYANRVYQAADKNYVLTGVSDSKAFIMKVDQATGVVIWSHRYTLNGKNSSGEDVIEDCNGNIIVTGASDGRILLLCVNSLTGNPVWNSVLDAGIGKTLIKEGSAISVGGVLNLNSIYYDHTFLLSVIPKNCVAGNPYTIFGAYKKYEMEVIEFDQPAYKKMLKTPSAGYAFLTDYVYGGNTIGGSTVFPDYRFNLVSTDASFISTRGIANMSQYCVPTENLPVGNVYDVVMTNTATGVLDPFSRNYAFSFMAAEMHDYVYCQDCPETIVDNINLTYCDPEQSRKWWNPCDYFSGACRFQIVNTTGGGSTVEYDSKVGYAGYTGCIGWQFNNNNTYTINFYDCSGNDQSGCLLRTLHVTVTKLNMATYSVSIADQYVDCNTTVDLNTNVACLAPGISRWRDAGGNIISNVQVISGTTKFFHECIDLATCVKIITEVTYRLNAPVQDNLNLTFCSPEQSRKWWNPCDYFSGADRFEIVNTSGGGSVIEYDSHIGYAGYTGCIGWQFNVNNTYDIKYYSAGGCLMKILHITVTQLTLSTAYNLNLPNQSVPCGTMVDPNTYAFYPVSVACGSPSIGRWVDASGNVVTSAQAIVSPTFFSFECIDLANCIKYVTGVNFIPQYPETTVVYEVPCGSQEQNCTILNAETNPVFNFCPMPKTLVSVTRTNFAGMGLIPLPPTATMNFCNGFIYNLEYVLPNGCKCIIHFKVQCAQIPPQLVPAEMENTNPNVTVFPNPSTGIYNIVYSGTETGKYTIVISDITGKMVYEAKNLSLNQKQSFDLSAYGSGVYTAKIIFGEQISYIKLLKQ